MLMITSSFLFTAGLWCSQYRANGTMPPNVLRLIPVGELPKQNIACQDAISLSGVDLATYFILLVFPQALDFILHYAARTDFPLID